VFDGGSALFTPGMDCTDTTNPFSSTVMRDGTSPLSRQLATLPVILRYGYRHHVCGIFAETSY
jgi:hypothetical protein